MKVLMLFIWLLICYLTPKSLSQIPPDLESFFKKVSNEMKNRRNILENEWLNRCSKKTCIETLLNCSPYSETDIQMTCSEKFPATECKLYDTIGSMINLKESIAHVPNRGSAPTQSMTQMSCVLASLDPSLKAGLDDLPESSWHYVGANNGVFRKFPGNQLSCDYDPRYRPWYVAAASGGKNVVLIIDNSGSMNDFSKIEGAKEATKNVVGTLTSSDYVGLVTFNSTATLHTPRLLSGSNENKDKIKSILDNLKAAGGTNYEDAIRKAYDLVRASRIDEIGPTSCQTIFLFLTDGKPKTGINDINNLVSLIESIEQIDKIDAIIMTYAFGSDADPSALIPISCARGGITQYVRNNLELKEKLQNYFVLLSRGITREENVWSEIYLDKFGLGNMTTAVLPFYDRTTTPPNLLGVIGIDFTVDKIQKYSSGEELLKSLVSTGCTKINLTQCQLEALRPQEYRCGYKNCNLSTTSSIDSSSCSSDSRLNGFKNWGPVKLGLDKNECCGKYITGKNITDTDNSIIGVAVGIGIGGFVGLFLIGLAIFCICRKCPCNNINPIPDKDKPTLRDPQKENSNKRREDHHRLNSMGNNAVPGNLNHGKENYNAVKTSEINIEFQEK